MCVDESPGEALVRRMNQIAELGGLFPSLMLLWGLQALTGFLDVQLSPLQDTAPGGGSADSWFQTPQRNWLRFCTT